MPPRTGCRAHSPIIMAVGFAATAAIATSACTGGPEKNQVRTLDVCGGLSQIAAEALEEITGSKDFIDSSTADVKNFSKKFSQEAKKKESETHTLCRITPKKDGESFQVTISFKDSRPTDVPPPLPDDLIGAENFQVGLRATGALMGADVYFECRTPESVSSEGKTPIVHATLSYDPSGKADLAEPSRNMDLLQHVARNVAGHLGCENHGDIPKRDKPW